MYTQEEQSMGSENPPENTDEKNLTNFAETQESSIFAEFLQQIQLKKEI